MPGQVADAPDAYIAAQIKGIVGVEIEILEIDGKWKVSQNRPAADIVRVAEALGDASEPHANAEMAGLVRKYGADAGDRDGRTTSTHHRHRRSRRIGQRHAGAPARRLLPPAASRHRADLPRRRRTRCSSTACRSTMSRRPRPPRARSISQTSTARRCRRMRSARPPRKVAVFPSVRKILVDKQRAFAAQPGGAVLDGRDIGTVVCPDADVKLYVTASAEVRAGRRLRDIEARGGKADLAEILADIDAARRARHGPRRLAAQARRRRALARYVGNVYRGRVPGGADDDRRRPCQAERSLSRVFGFRLPEARQIPISGMKPACQHSLAPVPPRKRHQGFSSPERRQANATLTTAPAPLCRGSQEKICL